ncbi:MAG: TetR/AcrR family transcriptional regulator [Anaerolineae bacterium]|nr:TetR/AcrR family transcriptional regulator [Anaerolineae bacterium]
MQSTLSRRERKKLETRQALLEAAWALFHVKGFHETTIEEITERADVAKGTFFNYFSSKDGLLGDLALWRFSRVREALDVGRGAPESPVARINLLLKLLHEEMVDDWPLVQQAFAMRLSNPLPSPGQTRQRLTNLLTDLVREAQERGEIRDDLEAEVVTDLIFVTQIRHLAMCAHKQGSPPPAGDSGQVIELLMDGLAGPGWQRRGREESGGLPGRAQKTTSLAEIAEEHRVP